MVQVGAPYDYHDLRGRERRTVLDEVIKDAVKEFVGAVAESSNQLASAAEKFAADSMHTIDEAAARAERSASSSTDMAQIAQKAAEDARLAADSLQSAVNEASERIRSEASEGAAIHLTQVQEAGERLRTDLQGHVDEMVSRMTAAAGSNEDAIAAAEAATIAAREAADRVQQSVSAVESAVANAQRAADEARAAAEPLRDQRRFDQRCSLSRAGSCRGFSSICRSGQHAVDRPGWGSEHAPRAPRDRLRPADPAGS